MKCAFLKPCLDVVLDIGAVRLATLTGPMKGMVIVPSVPTSCSGIVTLCAPVATLLEGGVGATAVPPRAASPKMFPLADCHSTTEHGITDANRTGRRLSPIERLELIERSRFIGQCGDDVIVDLHEGKLRWPLGVRLIDNLRPRRTGGWHRRAARLQSYREQGEADRNFHYSEIFDKLAAYNRFCAAQPGNAGTCTRGAQPEQALVAFTDGESARSEANATGAV